MDDYVWTPYQDVLTALEDSGILDPDVSDDDLENFDWENEDDA